VDDDLFSHNAAHDYEHCMRTWHVARAWHVLLVTNFKRIRHGAHETVFQFIVVFGGRESRTGGEVCYSVRGGVVAQIRHRFRDDAMADDLDMSGLRLAGMPDVHSPTLTNMDQSDVRTRQISF